MTLREIIYMVMDELKLMSDDINFNEDHIRFLVNKYRIFLLNQAYIKGASTVIPEVNYQTVTLTLKQVREIPELEDSKIYLKSIETVPNTLYYADKSIYSHLNNYRMAIVDESRFKFVGFNKWLKNIIYGTIKDNHLYLTSNNPQYLYLESVKYKDIFEDPELAYNINHPNEDSLDMEYPIDAGLVQALIASVVKELSPLVTVPEDNENNASDDKANLNDYVKRKQQA